MSPLDEDALELGWLDLPIGDLPPNGPGSGWTTVPVRSLKVLPLDHWATAIGEVLPIEDISTRHLRNILRYLRRARAPLTLTQMSEVNPRIRNLCNEWLRRFS